MKEKIIKSLHALLLVALLLAPFNSQAQGNTGRSLVYSCSDPIGKLFCLGYISGAVDMLNLTISLHNKAPELLKKVCLPPSGLSNDTAMRIVLSYLSEHPQEWGMTARTLIFKALEIKYPC